MMQTLQLLVHRYQYAALILLIGLGLMMLPQRQAQSPPVREIPHREAGLEEKLCDILSEISGAGRVEVLLTERTGAETLYQTDRQRDSDDSGTQEQDDTVLIDDETRSQTGLVRRRDPPVYLGALVVCQGADSPPVRLAVVKAVQCVTGLRSDQIQVVKMK